MKTKYSVGDIVKVGAKIEKIEIDEKGVKYMLSSGFWKGFKEVREGDLSSGSSRPASKTSAKTEKASAKTEKTSKNGRKRQKTAENGKEKQQGSTEGVKAAERQQDTAKRQQEQKRPGRPSKKEAGETTNKTTTEGLSAYGKELAKELAGAAE